MLTLIELYIVGVLAIVGAVSAFWTMDTHPDLTWEEYFKEYHKYPVRWPSLFLYLTAPYLLLRLMGSLLYGNQAWYFLFGAVIFAAGVILYQFRKINSVFTLLAYCGMVFGIAIILILSFF